MPTPFEIGMSVLLVGWLAVHAMIAVLAFPNSRFYHYLYAGDEFFGGESN